MPSRKDLHCPRCKNTDALVVCGKRPIEVLQVIGGEIVASVQMATYAADDVAYCTVCWWFGVVKNLIPKAEEVSIE